MDLTCEVCGSAVEAATPAVATQGDVGAPPAPAPEPGDRERQLRGCLYQELDLLAYALEMEAAEALERGEEAEAARTQQTRLGIRLAQRLVGAVPSPEVDRRLDRWRSMYQAKFPF